MPLDLIVLFREVNVALKKIKNGILRVMVARLSYETPFSKG